MKNLPEVVAGSDSISIAIGVSFWLVIDSSVSAFHPIPTSAFW